MNCMVQSRKLNDFGFMTVTSIFFLSLTLQAERVAIDQLVERYSAYKNPDGLDREIKEAFRRLIITYSSLDNLLGKMKGD